MARIDSLSILADPTGKALLSELYGQVIENVQKGTISTLLKNMNLSGDPTSGSVEANRFANATNNPYGTARGVARGSQIKAKPVVIQIDNDKEIVEEIEQKDIMLFGVDGLLQRRSANHAMALIRELEREFFGIAVANATTLTPPVTVTATEDILELLIQSVETVQNEYVDGVPRDLISVVCSPAFYGQIRNFLDTGANNASISTAPESIVTFHGVRIFSSVYIPSATKAICMADGSVAMPVLPRPYAAERIPLSEAWAVSLFYYYGVAAVTPDLIFTLAN